MKTAANHRSSTVWMLLSCILFSLFACGLHHGQMNARTLAQSAAMAPPHMAHAGHAAMHGDMQHAQPANGGESEPAHEHLSPAFTCPLCSSYAPALALGISGWALDLLPAPARVHAEALAWVQPPPRYIWPSLNPRASPMDFPRS